MKKLLHIQSIPMHSNTGISKTSRGNLINIAMILWFVYLFILYVLVWLFPALSPWSFSQDYGFPIMLITALILAAVTTAALYLIYWMGSADPGVTRARVNDYFPWVIRIAINAVIAFLWYALALSVLLIFFPSFTESVFDFIANLLGMNSDKFVEFLFQAIFFLAIITGAIREFINIRSGRYNNPDAQMPEAAQPVVSQPQAAVKQDSHEIVTCEYCGTKYSGEYTECPNCGTPKQQ